jgi:hypothetical protein
VNSERGSASRRVVAGLFALGFTLAIAAVLASQLALMSVLDSQRAERAAQEIAESRFTGQLIEQTVTRAIGPVIDPQLASQIAAVTSADPQVRGVVQSSLITAHRQVVEPEAAVPTAPAPTATPPPDGTSPTSSFDANESVQAAITAAIIDAGARNGVDLSGFTDQVGTPKVVPDDLPELGLRTVAERTRLIAGLAAIALAILTVLIHPRPGRSLAGLGLRAAIVCGAWLAGLLIAGWVIGLIADTLFGEMLESIWSAAVPSMILLTIAGVVLGAGIWFAGIAVDGLSRDRRPPAASPSVGGHQPEYRQPPSDYHDY